MPMLTPLIALKGNTRFPIPSFTFTQKFISTAEKGIGMVAVNPSGLWVAGGGTDQSGSDSIALSSVDGDTWIHRTTPVGGVGSDSYVGKVAVWGEDQFYGIWLTFNEAWACLTSAGAANWIDRPTSSGTLVTAIAYKPNTTKIFVIARNGILASSPTAQTWTNRSMPSNFVAKGVRYIGGQFVGVGLNTSGDFTQAVVTSPDGITWTARSLPSEAWLKDVIYSAANGLYCTVGSNNAETEGRIFDSPDAITWTIRANGLSNSAFTSFYSVAALDTGFIAVGISWNILGTGVIYASTNGGVTWSQKTSHPSTTDLRSVAVLGNKIVCGGFSVIPDVYSLIISN